MSSRPDLFIRVGIDTSALQKGLNRIEKKMVRSLRGLERIGNNIQRSITLPIVAAGAASVQSAVKVDKLRKSLTGIMGNAQMANVEFQKLLKLSKNPGFTLEAAIQGSVRLQAIGYSAEKARQQMEILGNAIALIGGSGQDLNGVILAISQIIGKGKVQAEEINQIAERLPQVRKIMQEAFGTADTEAIQEMKLSAEDFIDTVVTKMGNLPKAQKSLQDTFNQMRDDLMLLAAQFGQMFIPVIMKGVKVLQNLIGVWQGFSQSTKNTITTLAVGLGVGGPVLAGISRFALALKDMVGKITVTKVVIVALAVVIGLIVYYWDEVKAAIIRAAEKFREFYNSSRNFRAIWEGLKLSLFNTFEVVEMLGRALFGSFRGLFRAIGALMSGDFKKAWSVFKEGGDDAVDAWKNMMEKIKLNNAVAQLNVALGSDTDGPTPTEKALNGIENAAKKAGVFVKDLKAKLMDTLGLSGGPSGGETGPNVSSFDPGRLLMDAGQRTNYDFGMPIIESLQGVMGKSRDIVKEAAISMKDGLTYNFTKPVEDTFINLFEKLSRGVYDFKDLTLENWATIGEGINEMFQSIGNVVSSFYDNSIERLDQRYEKQKAYINKNVTDEEERNKRLAQLEEKADRQKRKIMRQQAKANKAAAIFDATIAGVVAVSQNLKSIPLAIAVGAIAAANVAAIASQPLPALAKGGIVSGDSVVRVGEYQGASFNPEVISPLDKLKGMIGSQMSNIRIDLTGGWRVNGYELETVLESANVQRSRLTA